MPNERSPYIGAIESQLASLHTDESSTLMTIHVKVSFSEEGFRDPKVLAGALDLAVDPHLQTPSCTMAGGTCGLVDWHGYAAFLDLRHT